MGLGGRSSRVMLEPEWGPMISAGGAPDLDARERLAADRDVASLRRRVTLLEHRLELVELALTSRERGWVLGLLRLLAGRR